jgi:hypothetical protein
MHMLVGVKDLSFTPAEFSISPEPQVFVGDQRSRLSKTCLRDHHHAFLATLCSKVLTECLAHIVSPRRAVFILGSGVLKPMVLFGISLVCYEVA